jgi:hypothetical protein
MTELGLADVRRMWDDRFGREVYAVFSAFVDIDYPTFVEFMTSVLPGLAEGRHARCSASSVGIPARYRLAIDRIVVNNVIVAPDSPFLAQKSAQQQERLRTLRERVGLLPITEVPLFPQEVQGAERLRQVAAVLAPED